MILIGEFLKKVRADGPTNAIFFNIFEIDDMFSAILVADLSENRLLLYWIFYTLLIILFYCTFYLSNIFDEYFFIQKLIKRI